MLTLAHMSETNVQKLLLSKRDAALALGVSVRMVENLIARRQLPVRKIGRRTLISFSALQRFAGANLQSGVAV
jgi:excisionase family DNA binding protein